MVLVWPRSTKPLEGSTVNPWCCKVATLSRLNSTICGRGSCWWEGRAADSGAGGQAARPLPPPSPARLGGAGAAQAEPVLSSPSLGSAGWSGYSPPAAHEWQAGPVCQCLAEGSPGSPGWASAPRFLGRVQPRGHEGARGSWFSGGWAGNAPDPPPGPPPPGSPSLRSGSLEGIPVRDSTGTSRGSPPSTNIMCSRAAPFRRICWETFCDKEQSSLVRPPCAGTPAAAGLGYGRGTRDAGLHPTNLHPAWSPQARSGPPRGAGRGRGEAAPSRRAPPAAGRRSTGSRGPG